MEALLQTVLVTGGLVALVIMLWAAANRAGTYVHVIRYRRKRV